MDNEVKNEIKSYIAKSGWTLTNIVAELNKKRPESEHTTTQNISNKLARGTIKYSEVKEIAAIIGYEVKWTANTQWQIIDPKTGEFHPSDFTLDKKNGS